jgi:uncharacterized protein YndB with AHSA1/START domain
MPRNHEQKSGDGTFVISRTFDASRELVWKSWSEAEQMQAWWGPKGCKIRVSTMEFRSGGFFHYSMQFPDGALIWGRFLYREIAAQKRIAWLNSFSNEGCGITRAPFDPNIPLEILNEVDFTEKSGKATLTLTARPHGASPAEIETFNNMRPSLDEGYSGTFDRLAAALQGR